MLPEKQRLFCLGLNVLIKPMAKLCIDKCPLLWFKSIHSEIQVEAILVERKLNDI